jgi:tRNA1(Val) A37 N6-methylase TrmN6
MKNTDTCALVFDDERIDYVNENISLIQKKNGLTFGTDAYLLAAFIKSQPNARAAELGCGTGIISMLCASRNKFKHIDAIEIQQSFAELSQRNIVLNNLEDKINIICSDVRNINVLNFKKEFDVVFTNPPYMKADCGKKNNSAEKYIARHECFGDITDFLSTSCRLLKHGGMFYCVYRPDRLSDLMFSMRRNNLEPKEMTFVYPDTQSPPAIVLVKAKKGASPSLSVSKPLIIYQNDSSVTPRIMTDKMKSIYENCNFTN